MRWIYAVLALMQILTISAQCQQTAEGWLDKGYALHDQGKYEESIQAYDEAINLNPNYAAAWSNKGLALKDLGKYDEAIMAYDEAIRLDPTLEVAWYNKG